MTSAAEMTGLVATATQRVGAGANGDGNTSVATHASGEEV